MKIILVKTYSTLSTPYSRLGRKMARVESKTTCSGDILPKYGRALEQYKAKENLRQLFN